jgi:DNA-binding protein H-NS
MRDSMERTYADLVAEREELDTLIAAAWESERRDALKSIRALMAEFGISPSDLVENVSKRGPRYKPIKSGRYVPRYRDPVSGKTWSGKGREPAWMEGKDRSAFSIALLDSHPNTNGHEPTCRSRNTKR